jgi:hypothetical protein
MPLCRKGFEKQNGGRLIFLACAKLGAGKDRGVSLDSRSHVSPDLFDKKGQGHMTSDAD